MDKKVLIGLIAGAVVLIGGITFAVLSSNGSSSSITDDNKSTNNSATKLVAIKACDLLTLDEAKQLLGNNATEGSNTSAVTGEDVNVDTCSYTNNGTTATDIRIVSVMARSALTEVGLDSNLGAFEKDGTANPANAVVVSNIGDKAFWDPTTYQLAILKGNTWLSIVYGGTNPTKNTIDDAKKAAALVDN